MWFHTGPRGRLLGALLMFPEAVQAAGDLDLADMSEGAVAYVVEETGCFHEVGIWPDTAYAVRSRMLRQEDRHALADLRDLQAVGEAVVVAAELVGGHDLGLSCERAELPGVEDAVDIVLERGPNVDLRLTSGTAPTVLGAIFLAVTREQVDHAGYSSGPIPARSLNLAMPPPRAHSAPGTARSMRLPSSPRKA